MCWKYEDLYAGHCWDFLLDDLQDTGDKGLFDRMRDDFGVEFDRTANPARELFQLFESWHERGLIKPNAQKLKAEDEQAGG